MTGRAPTPAEGVEPDEAPRSAFGPYQGLQPFSRDDEPYFHGRGRERRIIAATLLASRLTLLYGPSGTGKTSVLRAGVAADIAREGTTRAGRPELVVVIMPVRRSWADPPLQTMMDRIREVLGEALGQAPPRWAPPAPVGETLKRWTQDLDRLLLVLDQFEEYFRYHPDERGAFTLADELPRMVGDPDLPVNVLISMREDALARMDRFKAAIPGLFDHYLRMDHLDRVAAEEAVLKPLERWREGGGSGPVNIEDPDALLRAVLDDEELAVPVTGEAAADGESRGSPKRIETPYLQLVMSRLWEAERRKGSRALRVSTLTASSEDGGLGGPSTIVREHLGAAMQRLSETLGAERAKLAGLAFGYLVTPSGAKFAQTAGDLAAMIEHDGMAVRQEDLERALGFLCEQDNRILRRTGGAPAAAGQPPVVRYELDHDVLGPAVQGWAAARELEEERGKRRRARRQVAVLSVACGLAVFALVAVGVLAFYFDRQAAEASSREHAASAQALLQSDPVRSLDEALAAVDADGTAEAQDALRAAVLQPQRRELAGHDGGVGGIAVDAGGRYLLTADDGALVVHDLERRHGPLRLPHPEPVLAVAISPDGRLAASAAGRKVRVWDLRRCIEDSGACRPVSVLTDPPGEYPYSVAFARGSRSAGPLNAVHLAVAGRSPRRVERNPSTSADSLPPGRVRIFECSLPVGGAPACARSPIWSSAGMRNTINSVAFSPDGSALAAGGEGGMVRLWRAASSWRDAPGAARVIDRYGYDAYSLAFARDGALLATTFKAAYLYGRKGCLRAGPGECEPEAAYRHTDYVNAGAFSPDGTRVAVTGDDGAVRVWVRGARGSPLELRGHRGSVFDAEFGRDGTLFTAGADATARAWDPGGGIVVGAGTAPVNRAVVDPTAAGRPGGSAGAPWLVASVDGEGVLRVVDLDSCADVRGTSSCRPTEVSPDLGKRLWSVNFAPGGRRLVTAGVDGAARLFSVRRRGGRPVLEAGPVLRHYPPGYSPSDSAVNWASFNPRGDRVVTAGSDTYALLWDPREPRYVTAAIKAHDRAVVAADFTPDGRLLATASFDETVKIWDVAACEAAWLEMPARECTRPSRRLRAEAPLFTVAVSPRDDRLPVDHPLQGRYVVGGGNDGRVYLWDRQADDEEAIRTFDGHVGSVISVAFHPAGRLVASGGADGTTRIWDLETGRLRALFRVHGDRLTSVSFSPDGRLIVSGGEDGTTRLYPCETCGELDEVEDLAERRLDEARAP